MQYSYFKPEEFKRCSPSCDISQMNEEFMILLDCARSDAGIPFKLNSAYRSPEYDKSKGRSGVGWHTLGRAVDIRCTDSVSRGMILQACLRYGLTCGISKTFIHIDNRPLQVAFLY